VQKYQAQPVPVVARLCLQSCQSCAQVRELGTARASSGMVRASNSASLLLLLLQGWHDPCLWWHARAKIPAAFLVIFLT